MAVAALYQWVIKTGGMAAGFPNLLIHQNGGVHGIHIVPAGNETAPPDVFQIVLEHNTQRAVVINAGQAAVNLTAGVNKPSSFSQRDNII